ncbi:ImmA/IrrE family metallo-endopeptidase [Alteromonas sp. KUL106]|uniref:ImmA/IrrE family metallo-endopeptidase n=1 Tax=Alteromonas sp. KUL106 TaxID=2480799 RepID=UPI0012E6BA14|nr:ImmA/IrrE family metallo-endopeptidase [Alteromonas sp. KUL106]GFD67918.1 ImmA/IrrE family metallo-endopeptidase [Alteromonas sp. KUL106]
MAFVRKGRVKTKAEADQPDIHTSEDLLLYAEKKGIKTDPLNIAELAHELGIVVRYEPMDGDDSGSLEMNDKENRWIMTINSLHHPHRQRFTMAHELGHFIKHSPISSRFHDTNFFRNSESNQMETEANNFAADLLMPKDKFDYFVQNKSASAEAVAEYFQVSTIAARVRAKQLGYTGHGL